MPNFFRDGTSVGSGSAAAGLHWFRGGVGLSNGKIDIDSGTTAQTRIFSCMLHIFGAVTVTAADGYDLAAIYYTHPDVTGFAGSVSWTTKQITLKDENTYAIIMARKTSGGTISPADGANIHAIGDFAASVSDTAVSIPHTHQLHKMLLLSETFIDLPVGYPLLARRVTGDSMRAYGIPYSAVNITEGYVGVDVSMYTYLSALNNLRSIIYNDYYASDSWRGAKYGIDCTGFISAGWDLYDVIPTNVMAWHEDILTVKNPLEVQVLDALLESGHAMAVVRVERDEHGRVIWVQVNDAWRDFPRHRCFFWSEFKTLLSGRRLIRYAHVDELPYPSPLDYAFQDDPEAPKTFPDIMPYRGDRCVVQAGSDVQIQVLNSSGYTSIEVYKDGTKIDTKSSVADFTISAAAVGKYEVKMIGSGKTSSCYFNVASLTLALDGNQAVFTAQGVKAYSISAFKQSTMEGSSIVGCDKRNIHYITSEEIAAGSADISDLVAYATANNGYIRIKGYDEYGTIFAQYDMQQ